MSKGPWEARVGVLLNPSKYPEFVYAYKPVDSPLHGGAVRIDWLACDTWGLFWMIEVKQAALGRRTFNLETEITPLQRAALSDVSRSQNAVTILAVGQANDLYLFDWRTVCLQWEERQLAGDQHPQRLPLDSALVVLRYQTPGIWATSTRLRELFASKALRIRAEDATVRTQARRYASSRVTGQSASTSRRAASTPTLGRTQRSGRSSSA